MEDLLNTTDGGATLTPRLIAYSLKYLDLLQLATDQIHAGAESFLQIEQQLVDLRQQIAPKQFAVLLVNNSKLETNICLQTLSELPLRTVVESDGLQALTRALAEPFDLIITANEIPRLSGHALVAALKLTESRVAHCQTILLTSNKAFINSGKRDTDADYTIFKDAKLVQNLTGAVKRALSLN